MNHVCETRGPDMKTITFSRHALEQARERGTDKDEMRQAIHEGEKVPAKRGRKAFRLNLPFGGSWAGRTYESKQVMPVVADDPDRFVVVTVYVFYF